MKGIILAGGLGTRLYPITKAISKQLIPVYDKPMIYYPLSTLMRAGIREILIITTEYDLPQFKRLLGNGEELGLDLNYAIQEKPDGIAKAFIIGESFIGGDSVCLILGDNIFYGANFEVKLESAKFNANSGLATIFTYQVKDPNRYGVAELKNNRVISIEEKPINPKSNYAVTGLYVYPRGVSKKAKMLKPSNRGELEITDLNNLYLNEGTLYCVKLPRGFAWLDTGTLESLRKASNFVESIETRQGIQIACLEELSYRQQWITEDRLKELVQNHGASEYSQYLKYLLK